MLNTHSVILVGILDIRSHISREIPSVATVRDQGGVVPP